MLEEHFTALLSRFLRSADDATAYYVRERCTGCPTCGQDTVCDSHKACKFCQCLQICKTCRDCKNCTHRSPRQYCRTCDHDIACPSCEEWRRLDSFLLNAIPSAEKEKGVASVDLSVTFPGEKGPSRVQASRCFNGQAWSFTVRREADPEEPLTPKADWIPNDLCQGYAPKTLHARNKFPKDVALLSFGEAGDTILAETWPEKPKPLDGFLFITGSTGSGKSNIARGIIFSYLQTLLSRDPKRALHLVTYEDPIEAHFYPLSALANPEFEKTKRWVDYTPRQLGADCSSLQECTKAALRQTPTVFFAGELREASDIAEALRFGGTGHLVVATGHASSLFEAAKKVLESVKASTPKERAAYVPKILGIVHLRKFQTHFRVDSTELESSAVVPTLYRRCPQGVQNLIADGLASLLPFCPDDAPSETQHGSLGRQYLVRKGLLIRESEFKVDKKLDEALSPTPHKAPLLHPDQAGKLQPIRLLWESNWSRIRNFNASGQGEGIQSDLPLYMACAKDDINGL